MTRTRIITFLVCVLTSILFIALLTRVLPESAAKVVLDVERSTWPLTVQTVMWVVFFIGLGELAIRWYYGWLEEAQIAKMRHVCRKLQLQPGDRVVEAGSGWGGLALYMAKNHGVTVKSYNISREQVSYAREKAGREGSRSQSPQSRSNDRRSSGGDRRQGGGAR